MLGEAGYLRAATTRDLVVQDPENDVEFFFLRPRDIAIYVGEGTLDVGITGRDMLLDSGALADEVLPLGFAPSTFRFAAPAGTAQSVFDLDGLTVATSYAGLLTAYFARALDRRLAAVQGGLLTVIGTVLGVAIGATIAAPLAFESTGSTSQSTVLPPVVVLPWLPMAALVVVVPAIAAGVAAWCAPRRISLGRRLG